MMDGQVDLRYVRDNLGHASISTTSQYLHADDDDRHRATEVGLLSRSQPNKKIYLVRRPGNTSR
jgi:integrase